MAGLRLRLFDLLQKHYGKLLLATGFFLFFSYDYARTALKSGASLFVFADMATMDFHYATFAELPIYGWFLFSSLPRDLSAEMTRHRRFSDYFWVEFAPIVVFTLIYSALPTLSAVVIGLVTGMPLHSDEAALTALLAMLYQFAGLTFFALAVRFMTYALPPKITPGAVIAAYLFDVFTVQCAFYEVPYGLYLNNYFVLTQALVKHSVLPSLLIITVLSGLMALALRRCWGFGAVCSELPLRAAPRKRENARRHSPALSPLKWTWLRCCSNRRAAIAAAVLLCADWLYLMSEGSHSLGDNLLLLMEGYGQGCLDIKRLMFLLLFNGLPLYFAALSLDEQSSKVGSHVMVRQRKKTTCFLWGQAAYALFLACCFMLHFAAAALHTLFFGSGMACGAEWLALRAGLPHGSTPATLLSMSVVLRFTELLFFQALLVLLHCVTHRLSAAFAVILCGYLSVCFVPFRYWPFGLSSVLRRPTLGTNLYADFAVCMVIFAVPLIGIYIHILRRGVYALAENQ